MLRNVRDNMSFTEHTSTSTGNHCTIAAKIQMVLASTYATVVGAAGRICRDPKIRLVADDLASSSTLRGALRVWTLDKITAEGSCSEHYNE
jgi:hypothetical protein